MLHKKVTTKGTHILRKDAISKLKGDVQSLLGDLDQTVVDSIFVKGLEEQIWTCSGSKVSLYLLNKVPFFAEVHSLSLSEDDEDNCGKVVFPTIFFFIKYRALFGAKSRSSYESYSRSGNVIICRGATSRYLISGAHLMIPGIVDITVKESSRFALIFSLGCEIPYAVGFLTNNFLEKSSSGVGVYVLHCYKDYLWSTFLSAFSIDCGSYLGTKNSVPLEFQENEVIEVLANAEDAEDAEGEREAESERENCSTDEQLLLNEDDKLMFCLVETVKVISSESLPMKLSQFMSLFWTNYPRISANSEPIDFKTTAFKKALPYIQQFDWIVVEEESPGVHLIAKINNRGTIVRKHNATYAKFLEEIHIPRVEKERGEIERSLLANEKVLLESKVVSTALLYKAKPNINRSLACVLLLGTELEDAELFPSLEAEKVKKEDSIQKNAELSHALTQLYSSKHVVDNAKKYIREKSLICESSTGSTVPDVRLGGAFSVLPHKTSSIPITRVNEVCLQEFLLLHEITLETTVKGLNQSKYIPLTHILKAGELPVIELTVKRIGNLKVTVAANLEAVGFNLPMLCRQWKHQFSVGCTIVDPTQGSKRKPFEVHLQGSLSDELQQLLAEKHKVPNAMIRVLKR